MPTHHYRGDVRVAVWQANGFIFGGLKMADKSKSRRGLTKQTSAVYEEIAPIVTNPLCCGFLKVCFLS
jgi:hypothetical protein